MPAATARTRARRRRRAAASPEPDRPGLLGRPMVGHVLLDLAITPPAWDRDDDEGQRRAALKAYERAIPARPGRYVVCLQQPVVLRATFTLRSRGGGAAAHGTYGDRTSWHAAQPRIDNHVRLVTEVLALRGYVADRCEIACLVLAKRTGPTPGVRLYLRTLLATEDTGRELDWPPEATPGVVRPFQSDLGLDGDALGERPLPFCAQTTPPPPRKLKGGRP